MAAAVIAVLALATPASAQDKSLSERAESHFNEGRRLLDLGEFASAAGEYQKAYDLVPHPELLYHLGQASRLQGKKSTAIGFYRKYLAIEPTGRAADKSRKYVELLEKAIADEKAAAEWKSTVDPEPDTADQPPADESAGAAADDARNYQPNFAATAQPAVDEPQKPGSRLRLGGVLTAGVGVISLAVGIKFGVDASNLSDELSTPRAAWTDAELAKFEDGEDKERNAILFATLGGALIAGGAAMYYFGHRKGEESRGQASVRLTPVVGGSEVGVALGGAF